MIKSNSILNTIEATRMLALCIAVKRSHKNSVLITQKNKGKIAKEFNTTIATLNKYIDKCVQYGWMVKYGNHYKVIRFPLVLKSFRKLTDGLLVFDHQVISAGKTTNFKSIQEELFDILIIDNVVRPQKFNINKRKLLINNSKIIKSTERSIESSALNDDAELNLYSSFKMAGIAKSIGYNAKGCDKMVSDCEKALKEKHSMKQEVFSSARHSSGVLGVSKMRANKALRMSKRFRAYIYDHFVDLIHPEQYEAVKLAFPDATVVPLPNIKKIAIRFGSIITMNDKNHVFNFKKTYLELVN